MPITTKANKLLNTMTYVLVDRISPALIEQIVHYHDYRGSY
jgi:hypothetical protein